MLKVGVANIAEILIIFLFGRFFFSKKKSDKIFFLKKFHKMEKNHPKK